MKLSRLELLRVVFLAALLVLTGCRNNVNEKPVSQPALNSIPVGQFTDVQLAQKTKAEATRDQLVKQLLSELMNTMAADGAAKSIHVCKAIAPDLAKQLSMEGVRIGRTSFKLRNPENVPPEWAGKYVEQQVTEPTFVDLENQTLGALLPIQLQSTCLLCHGNDREIAADVKVAIDSNYPRDQATGFAIGDLRGYFWVEVDSR